jgi:hypothetical protein
VSGVNIGISWEGGKYLFEEGGLVFGTTYIPTVDKGQGKSRDGESDLGGGMGGGLGRNCYWVAIFVQCSGVVSFYNLIKRISLERATG